jgi:hypothetical protein
VTDFFFVFVSAGVPSKGSSLKSSSCGMTGAGDLSVPENELLLFKMVSVLPGFPELADVE